MNNSGLNPLKSRLIFCLFSGFFFMCFYFAPAMVTNSLVNWGWMALAFFLVPVSLFTLLQKNLVLPSRRFALPLVLFLLLAVVFSLVSGANLLEEKWSHRWIFLLLFAGLVQLFESPGELVRLVRYPLLVFVLALCGESLYQNLFLCQSSALGTSCYSSRFYNINMLSQTLLLGLVLLDYFRQPDLSKTQRRVFSAVIWLVLLVIVYSHSRSSYIALGLFVLSRLFISRKAFLQLLWPALVAVLVFNLDPRTDAIANASVDKKSSSSYRLELFTGSLRLIADRPLGVGINNFEYGFIPYRNTGALPVTIAEVDKTPHNDFLLVLAEEGWAVGLAFIFLMAWLFFKSVKQLRSRTLQLWPGFLLVALPELFFQFPSDMYFFNFAVALVLAHSCLENSEVVQIRQGWGGRSLLLTGALIIILTGIFRFTLWVPPQYSDSYCRVFHDNWKNCTAYFKGHYDGGNFVQAQKTLLPVIRYQPFNFVALHWDYLLGHSERNQLISCNYAALFKFQLSIPGSDISACQRDGSQEQLLQRFFDYSNTR